MGVDWNKVDRLLQFLKKKSGFQGNSFHQCKRISERMAAKDLNISPHTIARLFGVIKPKRRTYISTLDMIARYVGYEGWDHFESTLTGETLVAPIFSAKGVDRGFFNYSTARYALETGNFSFLGDLLDLIESDHLNYKWLIIDYIGIHCRNHRKDDKLFRFLAEHPVGRDYFYRTFVDEDDTDGYFSHSLTKYFLRNSQYEGDKLFARAFVLTRSLYSGKRCNFSLTKDCIGYKVSDFLGKDTNDYHILSRLFEIKINVDNSKRNVESVVDAALELENHFLPNDYTWIIGRIIRALYFNRYVQWACSYTPLIKVCEKILHSIPGGLMTPGDLFVQLNYFAATYKKNNPFDIIPRRARDTWLSTKESVLLEHLLIASVEDGSKRTVLDQSMHMAKVLQQFWAVPFVRHLQKSSTT